jgi:hypothetical protein
MDKPDKKWSPISRWGDYILATRQDDGTYVPVLFHNDKSLIVYGSRTDAEADRLPNQVVLMIKGLE